MPRHKTRRTFKATKRHKEVPPAWDLWISSEKTQWVWYPVNWNISVTGGKKINRDFVSSGERKRIRPRNSSRIEWEIWVESQAKEGDSPVGTQFWSRRFSLMSKTRFLSCWNQGGPPSKPKYILVIDSEQVPWGKGEKDPYLGSEKDSETEWLQAVGAYLGMWQRTFCIMGQRVNLTSKLKPWGGGLGNTSWKSATMLVGFDPKPSDLIMSRLKIF